VEALKVTLFVLLVGWLIFELIEHVISPLVWASLQRRRPSICGPTGMIGKVGEIRSWNASGGKINVNGEIWQAVGDFDFLPGDKVVIRQVEGLKVSVSPYQGEGGR
jgi:membrane protein implicated in regulation of membrane protease activity